MNPTSPGWFPSQTHSDEELFWDGERWTGATRQLVTSPPILRAEGNEAPPPNDAGGPLTASPGRGAKRRLRLILAITAVVTLATAGVGTLAAVQSQRTTAAAESERRERDADRVAANERAAAEREAAMEASERESRALTVTEIEGSVKAMADGNATDGLHEPVASVACSPVDGGSTDDLTDQTTAFDCFAVTTDNPDGTQSGYYYNATVNWTTMEYTYGYGRNG